MNEAEAVNAQRDAHMVGGSVLERRMNWLEEKRRGWSPESGGWGGADRDAGRIAELERQRDAAMELLADARAEAARYAGRLIVACEERDEAALALEQRDIALTIATTRGDVWQNICDAWQNIVVDAENGRDDAVLVLEGYRERITELEALVDRLLRNLDSLQTAHDAWQRIAKAGR